MVKREFNLEDIIVIQGVITKFGVIVNLIDCNDEDLDIRMADKEEIFRYTNRP